MPPPKDPLAHALLSQFEAAFAMLRNCMRACPAELWDAPVAKYPFWLVAYHVLYCTDGYLATTQEAWQPHPTFHPAGFADINSEYPSRNFSQPELLAYLDFCLTTARNSLAAETAATLTSPSGFPRLPFCRTQLHLYNLRHLQHHTGQLTALLHRHNIQTPWVKSGYPE